MSTKDNRDPIVNYFRKERMLFLQTIYSNRAKTLESLIEQSYLWESEFPFPVYCGNTHVTARDVLLSVFI